MEKNKNKWLNAILILSISLLLTSIIGIIISSIYLIDGANIAVYGLIISLWVMLMGTIGFILACYWKTRLLINENSFGIKKVIVLEKISEK